MRAAALLIVFLLAKLAILWGHSVPVTAALGWQDAAVALFFGLLDRCISRTAALYWAIVGYTAINIPVGRAVFTPLTRPMLRAARGPLADSMLQYVTVTNVLLICAILTCGFLLPRLPHAFAWVTLPCALLLFGLGAPSARRADTRGFDRNVITALLGACSPARSYSGWSPPLESAAEDLSPLSGSARKFNVVMVSLESTAAQYLGLYGAASDPMPQLSTMARHALVFDNAYAVYPESIKGLFSVLCSRYPAFNSRPEDYESAPCSSIPAMLQGSGYRTAMFHSGRFGYLGMEFIIRHRGYQTLEDAGEIGGNHESSFGVDEPATVARMLAWIDALPRGAPFFLTYLPIAGHHPYATPQPGPFPAANEIDQYRNALHYGDESIGAFADGLRARGLDRNTIWIIYGDHGEAFHQHEGNYGHTFFVYEENVHVPFLIAAPGLLAGQRRVRKVVSLADIAPSILDLLSIPRPPNYQGRSVLDHGQMPALFFTDYSLGLVGLRDGPWKFVQETGTGRRELYNLESDPQERFNLARNQPERAASYSRMVYLPTSTKAPQ